MDVCTRGKANTNKGEVLEYFNCTHVTEHVDSFSFCVWDFTGEWQLWVSEGLESLESKKDDRG